jgi:putative ABC transport system permease protein
MIAALAPALRAASEEPADAVRRVPRHAGLAGKYLPSLIGLVLIAIGLGCFALRGMWIESRYGTYGAAFFTFVGAVTLTIPLAGFAARLLQPFVRSFLGVEERLAGDNLTRAPLRTGLVIAILAAFVALMMQTAGVTLSSEDAVMDWVDGSISAHLFVTANSPITASGQNLAMPPELGDRIAGLPEVERCVKVRYQQVHFRDDRVFLIALDPDFYSAERLPNALPGLQRLPLLKEPGTALISENFALLHRVGEGDQISIPGPRGPVELRVMGTVVDYSWNRGTVIMGRDQYVYHFDDPLVDVFNLYIRSEEEQVRLLSLAALSAAPQAGSLGSLPWALLCQNPQPRSQDAVSETVLRHWGAEEALVVMTRQQLRESIRQMIQRLYGIGYIQEAVVGLVAAMGVVTALLISVLQRRRELGLLRAVGASRGQVLRTVLAEAVLMGLLGAICGLAIGVPMEWYAVRVILLEEAGFNFGMSIPWRAVGVVTALAMLTATLAGLFPALHAIRLRIAEAIAYE